MLIFFHLTHKTLKFSFVFFQIAVNPQKSFDYVQQNRNKKVVYRTFLTDTYNNTAFGSSFNSLIDSGLVHPAGVLIVPFIGAVPNSALGDFHWNFLY